MFIGAPINEPADLAAETEHGVLIDVTGDVRAQVGEILDRAARDEPWLRQHQAEARRLFERYRCERVREAWPGLFDP